MIREISDSEAKQALSEACSIVVKNLNDFSGRCQNHSSVNGIYPACENVQWTCGFWPGEIWLAFEALNACGKTAEAEECRKSGEKLVESFLNRIENHIETDHHDMGFLYSPSCVSAWKLTGNKDAQKAALLAADQLAARFQKKGNFIQAWGKMGEAGNYRYIIDCLMNTPLLYWATQQTGNENYTEIANLHTKTCMENSIRADGSTFHTFFMDINTGKPLRGVTCQGYKDDSFWARGQAWSIYGTALAFRYTKNAGYVKTFRRCLDFYLSKLPQDLVPYWDMIFTSGSEPRDSSSASIVACGLLEMANLIESEDAEQAAEFRSLAKKMIFSLATYYAVKNYPESNGIVLHGTYSKKSPYNTCTQEGVDECVSWGDYFYMEALTRLTNPAWEIYW
ncbi:MAG: glycoside hydrolase family 88 protein [Treponema sp.]|nr:glycoside hydrolase family 88 protein [Treponema sp.]